MNGAHNEGHVGSPRTECCVLPLWWLEGFARCIALRRKRGPLTCASSADTAGGMRLSDEDVQVDVVVEPEGVPIPLSAVLRVLVVRAAVVTPRFFVCGTCA